MKKTLAGFIIALMFSIFSVSYTFAAGNFQNDVRNVVGGAENVVEDAGSAIGRTVQSPIRYRIVICLPVQSQTVSITKYRKNEPIM